MKHRFIFTNKFLFHGRFKYLLEVQYFISLRKRIMSFKDITNRNMGAFISNIFKDFILITRKILILIVCELNKLLVLRGQWKIKPQFSLTIHSLLIIVTIFIHCRLKWFQKKIMKTLAIFMIQIQKLAMEWGHLYFSL